MGFWKIRICQSAFDSTPATKDFSDEMGDINEYNLLTWHNGMLTLYNETLQH